MDHPKHLTGLSGDQVAQSRRQYGPNTLTPPARTPVWKLFLEKFDDPIIRILLVAAFLSLGISVIHNEYAETIGIFCAIFLSIGVAFWFELDANKKFDVLNQVNDDIPVKVIRNGQVIEVPKQEIVVGDIVVLETGEEVPADGELLQAISLQLDESSLTGEPLIDKSIRTEDFDPEATYPTNWVLRGTSVMDGHGVFEVRRVGDATEYGKVAEKSTEMTSEATPLNQQLDGLAKLIGVAGLVLAVLTFSMLFTRYIFFSPTLGLVISWGQLGLIMAVMAAVVVALVKVWAPILYDGLELSGHRRKLPRSIEMGSWLKWVFFGMLTFAVMAALLYLLWKVNPFDTSVWSAPGMIEAAGHVLQFFMVAVTLVVVAVPEGLPMSVTLSLALSMRRMLKTNNLVRKMHACETMGATTVICTDKTGTLTQNRMRVAQTKFYALGDLPLNDERVSLLIKEGISVNSTAFLDFTDPDNIKTLGNPTEAALLFWLNAQQQNYITLREEATIVQQLTFSTERKYMATLVNSPLIGQPVLYVKGAPEIVLAKCRNVLTPQGEVPATTLVDSISEQLLSYQNQAMRTLGFAYKLLDNTANEADIRELSEQDLTFLGIAAISDPIRPDVPDAVKSCLDAGINVKIVTGDTPGTAKEIGRQIAIWSPEDSERNIITGPQFEALSDEEALARVDELKIMCRARPTDKQRLVSLLQQRAAIVAVTGDGTNDAPALNHAQVGLSMGTGTAVAKEASDITLLDDSFNSIATAVMWGRSLYKNIQRFILFQLTINVAALILVFLGSIFGQDLPLTVTQMLWVNLIMDTFAAGALASLPPDVKVMHEKPRRNSDFIVTPAMRNNILFVGISFVVLLLGMLAVFYTPSSLDYMFDAIPAQERMAYALSVFFTTFVLLQFWNMFNAKAFGTGKSAFARMSESKGFLAVAAIILAGQFLIVQFGGEVFRTVPLMARDWLIILGGTSIVLWLGEIARLIDRK